MADWTNFGMAGPQDPIYGISRSNIVRKLTRLNWNTRAIVRNGIYVWVARGRHHNNGVTAWRYFVRTHGKDGYKKIEKDFHHHRDALVYANGLSELEGPLPREEFPGFYIGTLRRAPGG